MLSEHGTKLRACAIMRTCDLSCMAAWMQIRVAQDELAARLGPEKLAFLQKRAAQKRSAAANAANVADGTPESRTKGVGAVGRYKPSGTVGQAGTRLQPAAAPELSDQQCEAGPPDVHKLVQDQAGKGAPLCIPWPLRALPESMRDERCEGWEYMKL